MNNFEKRLMLDYLERLSKNKCFTMNSSLTDFLEEILDELGISKKRFLNYFQEDEFKTITPYNYRRFNSAIKKTFQECRDKIGIKHTFLEKQFLNIKNIYRLDKIEYDVFVYYSIKELNSYFDELYGDLKRRNNLSAIKCSLPYKTEELEIMQEELRHKNIIHNKYDIEVNSNVIRVLTSTKYNTKEKIVNLLIGKPEKATLKISDYQHIEHSAETAIEILSSAILKKQKGVNILLYGTPGTGKTEFAKLMAKRANAAIYSVITRKQKFQEASREERLGDLCQKEYLLSRSDNACILFDEAEDAMNNGFSYFDKSASKGYLNHMLETTAVPVIWTTNNIEEVDPAFLRRMTYTIEFEKLSDNARLNIWNRVLAKNKFKIKKSKLEELNKSYDIAPSIISNAIQTTKMIGGDENRFEELIESVATVVEKKKIIKKTDNFNPEQYNIKLINADLDINNLTDKILKSGKLNFSLCLYGEPGTGKSEYAKYLADKLGVEVIDKKVSDLMSMYLGGTEKNIACAFAEAKDKKAMLIFDEADSFLQNRNNAQRSWEVTQVNEMLTWMESHQYPFICTTNLINSLDEASLRRFTFKVKFDFMKPEQVNKAIEHFFGIKNSSIDIKGLTTGDFATVKKKVDFLGMPDINELEKMLADEVKVKKSPNLKNTVGF